MDLPAKIRIALDGQLDAMSGASRRIVLVVEDDLLIRMVLIDMLHELGHAECLEADSGQAALALLQAHPEITDLILDLTLPDMDGTQLAPRARELLPSLHIVIATGLSHDKVSPLLVSLPGSFYLSKPYGIAQVAEAMGQVQPTAPRTG